MHHAEDAEERSFGEEEAECITQRCGQSEMTLAVSIVRVRTLPRFIFVQASVPQPVPRSNPQKSRAGKSGAHIAGSYERS
jgi:hypothetical protein